MRVTRPLLLGLSMALTGTLSAQALEVGEPGPAMMARVETAAHLPDDCLASVEITRVDGQAGGFPPRGFLIEPGRHSFNGRALLDTHRCQVLQKDLRIPPAQDLVIELEAGKVYSIAYDRSHPDPEFWRLVVWKVTEMPVQKTVDPVDGLPDEPDPIQ